MNKKILLDVDGVVIRPRHKYFSDKLSEDYGIPIEDILPFFKTDYKKAAKGQEDLKDILPSYLKQWNWTGTVDDFLNYWFESEKDVDQRVIDLVAQLRTKGIQVFLASDNEAHRAKYLMQDVGLEKHFDGSFFSSTLGWTKSDPEFFKIVVDQIGCLAEEIEYWDDDSKNVDIASEFGIDGRVYSNFEDLKESLSL